MSWGQARYLEGIRIHYPRRQNDQKHSTEQEKSPNDEKWSGAFARAPFHSIRHSGGFFYELYRKGERDRERHELALHSTTTALFSVAVEQDYLPRCHQGKKEAISRPNKEQFGNRNWLLPFSALKKGETGRTRNCHGVKRAINTVVESDVQKDKILGYWNLIRKNECYLRIWFMIRVYVHKGSDALFSPGSLITRKRELSDLSKRINLSSFSSPWAQQYRVSSRLHARNVHTPQNLLLLVSNWKETSEFFLPPPLVCVLSTHGIL